MGFVLGLVWSTCSSHQFPSLSRPAKLRIALTHRTHYSFHQFVTPGPHLVRLRPAPHCRTPIRSESLQLAPNPHFINWQQDPFGNFVARVLAPNPTQEFSATVDLVADMTPINAFDFFIEPQAANWPFAYS